MIHKDYEAVRTILLDESAADPLHLTGPRGLEIDFEQVFAVEHEERLFCILRPLARVEGLSAHAALVFWVDVEGVFRAVKDRALCDEIFSEYYGALSDARNKGGQ